MGISNPENKPKLALIAGPTASGKTALALRLAKKQDVFIINADSAQVYSDLPVLSAQPTPGEMAAAPHRLFGYLDGTTACSAARWANDAKRAITEAHDAGALPVLVGGTGLYVRTLLDGIAPIPEVDAQLRAAVRDLPVADAYAALTKKDPEAAAALAPTDSSRISRALEVIESTGRSILSWRRDKVGGIGGDVSLLPIILLPPRDWLYERCDRRFDLMVKNGAVEEVAALLERKLPADAPVMRAIGVREIAAMLAGSLARDEAVALGKIATRQYAKRQYTWFRNQAPATWSRCDGDINGVKIDDIVI
ncbi:tRNA (adenosine(37)-N6)-dimethylallyltransferase MiaA [Sphingorhabdus lacus]|uniref:tRNA dimethylallyltransferase n=1 Tax=Sphingorhabdus lacus TaxID=392610 RepID=A0A6I6L5W2_9SPHN|nr:tRNA (adenosine(37)-N6)-dimethylallyltransferase MiaA [Sphingorhabdus lacus]QGY79748.1 tRNA (adenosine(37)-N6)-dimethylallyltransferase MiaA [Sphingorhabdus lacus]